jgi:outer membrane receptor protein involved in Fe transport
MKPSILLGLALVAWPGLSLAQQPQPTDTARARQDSLTREPVTLQAVTITTTPAVRYEPSSAVKVTPSIIEQVPSINALDLLRQSTGLEVHEQGQGPGFASDASIRGFSSDHSTDIALWVDGVPINEPVNGHAEGYNDWSLLMPEAISSIDVLKGPTSALFGNFAMAGVVNVRTLERLQGTRLTASGGTYGQFEGAVLTGVDRASTGAVLGLRGVHDAGWRPNSAYDLGQAHARWVHTLSGQATLDAGAELYLTRWNSPGFLTDSQFQARQYDVVENRSDGGFKRRAQERVSLKVFAGPALLWRSTVYSTQGRWQLFLTIPPEPGSGEGTGSQTEEEDTRYGFGATSALTWALPRGDITVGVEGRWDHADYQNWLTTDRRRDSAQTLVGARQASGAVFLQASLDLTRHIRTTVGGRYAALGTRSQPVGQSSLGNTNGIFAPKFGLLVHVPGLGALYGNISRGYRQTDGVIEDPTLPFITEWVYETGAKLDLRGLSAGAALFRVDVSNEQTFNPITLTSTSGGASRRQGVELELDARPSPWLTLSADWTFTDARYRQLITEDGDTLSGARVFNTAKYVGVASVEVAPPDQHWQVRLATNVVGPYSPFDAPGVVDPAYALFHLSGGLRIAGVGLLEVGIRNLFDRAYPELRAGDFVTPGQPRALFATLRAGL